MALLQTGLFDKYAIRRIGVAGHPEESPDIATAALDEALARKNRYAAETGTEMYIPTQIRFDAGAIVRWEREIGPVGNRLPIIVGIAGPATLKMLRCYATTCGVSGRRSRS